MSCYEKRIRKYCGAKTRIWEIDLLRGFCICLMILDHFFFSLFSTFSYLLDSPVTRPLVLFANTYYMSALRYFGWVIAVVIFVFLSGISSSLTKSNLQRGLKLLLISLGLTFVTYLIDFFAGASSFSINFGVLHCLSLCMIIYALCIEQGKKITLFTIKGLKISLADLFITILVGIVFYLTSANGLPLYYHESTFLYPDIFYTPISESWNFIMGLLPNALPSSDYLPLLPWLGVFLIGAFVGDKFYPDKKSLFPSCSFMLNTPFARIGKKTLLVYIVHIPVIYLLLSIVGLIFTGRFFF